MKHHFADFLDREGDYWTVVPNRERFIDEFECTDEGDPTIQVALIGKDSKDWEKCLTLPNLEEITLHEANSDQFEAVSNFTQITRLRVTHFRPKHIEGLAKLANLEELVLEYVSGFSDLSPLSGLSKLRSLHLENLRRVSDFSGLMGSASLRYLSIFGTLDWNQPIDNFEFLRGLQNLEHLGLSFVTSACKYPAFLPAIALKRLKRIKLAPHYFSAQEYALLSAILEECLERGGERIGESLTSPWGFLSMTHVAS
ncbi:MAG: leucine-rich repeat domain-containing protein [Rhodocyclaceae bacterium]|nr:leucine-rich repeat domain-containing protein [Rhodocyclaceae bacterium]